MLSFSIPQMTFDEFLHRLQNTPNVLGLLAMGSTGKPHFKSYSDYDLVIVLDNNAPSLFAASTWINGQLGDLYFFRQSQIETLIRDEQVSAGSVAGSLIELVQIGTILFDREGLLEGLKSTVKVRTQMGNAANAAHRTGLGLISSSLIIGVILIAAMSYINRPSKSVSCIAWWTC